MRPEIRTLHITPASVSLDVLLRGRLAILKSRGFSVAGFSTDKGLAGRAPSGDGDFVYINSRHLTRRFDVCADIGFMFETFFLLRKLRPHIVNTYGPKPGVFGRIAARLAGVPVIVHTSWGMYFESDSPWHRKYPMIAIERFAAMFCDYVFSVNKDDLELMKKYRFLKPDRLGHLGNATDTEVKFNPARFSEEEITREKARLGIVPSALVVGMAGRLTRSKGYREYFEAARGIRAKRSDVEFVAVGDFDDSKGDGISKEEMDGLEAGGVIRHLGAKTPDEMPLTYAVMDIVALPSYREGFPRTLVEAASMGKPLITTDTRGCREAVEHGKNGLLISARSAASLKEAIETLVSDTEARTRMAGESRRKAVREFGEPALVEKVIRVYERFITEKGLV